MRNFCVFVVAVLAKVTKVTFVRDGHGGEHDAFLGFFDPSASRAMRTATEELILILSTAPKRDVKPRLEQRVVARLCLYHEDDGVDCNQPATKNGCCTKCDSKLRYFVLSERMSEAEEQRFYAKLEREGKRCRFRKRKEILRKLKRRA